MARREVTIIREREIQIYRIFDDNDGDPAPFDKEPSQSGVTGETKPSKFWKAFHYIMEKIFWPLFMGVIIGIIVAVIAA